MVMLSSENINYFVNFTKNHVRELFNGNMEACNRYIEENLGRIVSMMDRYSSENNQWWLEDGENMAYHQLKEIDSMLVEYSQFIDQLSRLVNRPITSLDINKNYPYLVNEANIAYTNFMREKILSRYLSKEQKSEPEMQIF